MKRLFLLIVALSLIFFMPIAEGGMALSEGAVTISALETKTICNLMIFSTIPGTTKSHIEYGSNIMKYVEKIEPNDFNLKQIQCPEEANARRECVKDYCREGNNDYCRIVCTTFKGPFELSWEPKPITISGSIKESAYYGSAVIMNALSFQVVYTQYSLKLLVGMVGVIAAIIILIVFLLKRKTHKRAHRHS